MTTISLRAYNKEIDGLIDNGQKKEAIAHCRYILTQYPKHIETYRLLGKAYVESQRYTEASDVLQRVLSCLPDDFVSQVGMSMIREDEGNLDAAIFHMERAFEAQPANTAVQGELKRLYGRRDGVMPTKIRLTRGALVRMYARGDLYQQAIAEARVALVEQPDRVDLQVILARMYLLSGQKVSATEVSSKLVEVLPYCYEANRILAEVLPGTSRSEDAKVYQQRLIALDPYLAHVPAGSATAEDAPDDAVMLNVFEGDIEEEVEGQPAWAQTVGVQIEEPEKEELPDWLTSVEAEPHAEESLPQESPTDQITDWENLPIQAATGAEDITAEPDSAEEEIPDWMAAAGWQASRGEAIEEPGADENISQAADDLAASEGEIPDWLQAIAPVDESLEPGEEPEEPPTEEDNTWLESILVDADQKAGTLTDAEFGTEEEPIQPIESEIAPIEENPIPEEPQQPEVPEIAAVEESAATLPDWLTEMTSSEMQEAVVDQPADQAGDEDWLNLLHPQDMPIVDEPATVETSAAEPLDESPLEDETFLAASVLPGLGLEEIEDAGSSTPPFATDMEAESVDENPPAFIDQTEPEPAMTSEDFFTTSEETAPPASDATQPTQIHSEEYQNAPIAPIFTGEEKAAEIESPVEPAEAAEVAVPTEAPVEGDSQIPALVMADEEDLSIFDLNLSEGEVLPDEIDQASLEAIKPEDIEVPDWLKESLDTQPIGSEVEDLGGEVEKGALETGASLTEASNPEMDDAAAFAWLESLAARQGADEETLQTAPEERPEETPEWVTSAVEAVTPETEVPEGIDATGEETHETEPPITESEVSLVEESVVPAEEIPPADLELSAPEVTPEEETLPAEETPVSPEPVFAEWLKEETTIEPETTALETEAVPEEELPDWLKETLQGDEEEIAPPEEESAALPPLVYRAGGEWQPEEPLPAEHEAEAGIEVPPAAELTPEQPALDQIAEQTPVNLEEMSAAEPEPVGDEMAAVPSPLAEETPVEEEPVAEEVIAAAEPAEEVPSISKAEVEEPAAQTEPVLPEDTEPEEIPDWLQGLAEETPATAQPSTVAADAETPPGWLKELEGEESGLMAEVPAYSSSTAKTGWLTPIEQEKSETSVEDTSPVRVTPPVEVSPSAGSDLYNAQAALNAQDIDGALEHYNRLIIRGEALEDTIHDLRDALDRYPVDVSIWQSLGDAYARSNQLQEALDAYTKAEELLR